MRFEDALDQHPAPRRVGDISLSYDPPVLVGQTKPRPPGPRRLPDLLLFGGFCAGAGAVGALLASPGGSVRLPLALAALAGLLVFAATRAERVVQRPRRFVLHFLDETLRVDLPGTVWRPGSSRRVPFDHVRAVYVLERAGDRYALAVDASETPEGPPQLQAVLVDDVPPQEVDELRRLWVALEAAFGLRR